MRQEARRWHEQGGPWDARPGAGEDEQRMV